MGLNIILWVSKGIWKNDSESMVLTFGTVTTEDGSKDQKEPKALTVSTSPMVCLVVRILRFQNFSGLEIF